MKTTIAFLMTLVALHYGEAIIYPDNCSLAKALYANGLPKNQLPDWVCLVQAESGGNTAAVNNFNRGGSKDYGLFQINSIYWCKSTDNGKNVCKVNCNSLLDNNIKDDVNCAKIIYRAQGFSAWAGWNNKCQGAKPNLSKCGL